MLVPIISPKMLDGIQRLYRNHSCKYLIVWCLYNDDNRDNDDDGVESNVEDIDMMVTVVMAMTMM